MGAFDWYNEFRNKSDYANDLRSIHSVIVQALNDNEKREKRRTINLMHNNDRKEVYIVCGKLNENELSQRNPPIKTDKEKLAEIILSLRHYSISRGHKKNMDQIALEIKHGQDIFDKYDEGQWNPDLISVEYHKEMADLLAYQDDPKGSITSSCKAIACLEMINVSSRDYIMGTIIRTRGLMNLHRAGIKTNWESSRYISLSVPSDGVYSDNRQYITDAKNDLVAAKKYFFVLELSEDEEVNKIISDIDRKLLNT